MAENKTATNETNVTSAAKVPETKPASESTAVKTEKKAASAAPAAPKKRGPKPGSKKTPKEALKPEVIIQFQGREATIEDAIEKAKGEYVAAGHRVSSIKSLQVYLKPEEAAAYYVINQKFAGKVDLF